MLDQKLPYRRYSIGPVFRDEPVSSARLRQITQCDIDIMGSVPRDEAEVLSVAKEVLTNLGIDYVIKVNNRRLLNEILTEQGVLPNDLEQVIREIDKINKLPKEEVVQRLSKYGAEKVLPILELSLIHI